MSEETTSTMAAPILRQNVRWGERYVSSGLNRKFAGIIPPGVYHGFKMKPGGAMTVLIDHDENYKNSVAVVERNGFSLNVTMDDPGYVVIPHAGKWFIVIEAYYVETQPGYQRIVAREVKEDYHIVLGTVTTPEDADATTIITEDMLSDKERDTSNIITYNDFKAFAYAVNALLYSRTATWIADHEISNGDTITLPNGIHYKPSESQIDLYLDGILLIEGENYVEVQGVGDEPSDVIRILFDVPMGSQFRIRVRGGSPEDLLDTSAIFNPTGTGAISERLEALENQFDLLDDDLDTLAENVAYVGDPVNNANA